MPWPQPNSTLGRCPGRNRIQRWADALAATEFNANRAERLLANPTPSHSSDK